MATPSKAAPDGRALTATVVFLLSLAFVTGGSSQLHAWDDTAVQLLALPVLAWALWRFCLIPGGVRPAGAALLMAALALVPLVQLLPLPEAVWALPEARRQLAADLAVVGVEPTLRWSLAPAGTLEALLFLLPPMAVFAATVTLPRRSHEKLLLTVMLLAMGSLLLAFLQLGVPAESVLNPFPQWAYQFNGIFANQNHQAIAMVVATVIALSRLLAGRGISEHGGGRAWAPWLWGFCALFALIALPLTGSRGAVLVAVFSVAAVPMAAGAFAWPRLRSSRFAKIGLAGCAGLAALGAWGAIGWMQVDAIDELRGPVREATWQLGVAHAPLGAGMGAFVQAFAHGGHDDLLFRFYVNHAHNEYVQWWMEAGWLGVAAGALVLVILAKAALRALGSARADRFPAVAAAIGLAALLLHSWVDYPLRTTSLAVVAATLAGILLSRAAVPPPADAIGETRTPSHTG